MKFPVVPTANPKQLTDAPESVDSPIAMSDLCSLIWCALIGLFRPRAALEAENLVLRHQLNVLRRKAPKRVALSSSYCLSGFIAWPPGVLDALKIIRPETLMRWHHAGFRAFWRERAAGSPLGGPERTGYHCYRRQALRNRALLPGTHRKLVENVRKPGICWRSSKAIPSCSLFFSAVITRRAIGVGWNGASFGTLSRRAADTRSCCCAST
jgi:hypothetical protein